MLDLGSTTNITKALIEKGADVTVYPYNTSSAGLLKHDAIVLSEGPGNPKDVSQIFNNIKELYNSNVPIFGIGLGHEIMALSNNIDIEKLTHGHRGVNVPIKDLITEKVYITSQNHSYGVVESSIDKTIATPIFVNINDGTIEGLKYVSKNITTIQFGLNTDTEHILDEFLDSIKINEMA